METRKHRDCLVGTQVSVAGGINQGKFSPGMVRHGQLWGRIKVDSFIFGEVDGSAIY